MSNIKQRVEKLMQRDANFRNNDKALILQIWKEEGLELTSLQIDRFKMTTGVDSILRRRREASHKFPASEAVTNARFKHYKEYREELGKVRYPGIKRIERKPSLWSRLTGRKV